METSATRKRVALVEHVVMKGAVEVKPERRIKVKKEPSSSAASVGGSTAISMVDLLTMSRPVSRKVVTPKRTHVKREVSTAPFKAQKGSSLQAETRPVKRKLPSASTTSAIVLKPAPKVIKVPRESIKVESTEVESTVANNSGTLDEWVVVKKEPVDETRHVGLLTDTLPPIPVKTESKGAPKTTNTARAGAFDPSMDPSASLADTGSTIGMKRPGFSNLQPAVKRPKGLRSVIKARKKVHVNELDSVFVTPEPLVLNDHWVYFAVPQKKLFRDLLNMNADQLPLVPDVKPPPDLTLDDVQLSRQFEMSYEQLQREQGRLRLGIATLEKGGGDSSTPNAIGRLMQMRQDAALVATKLEQLEVDNQRSALDHSRKMQNWHAAKDALEHARMEALRSNNEVIAKHVEHIEKGLEMHRKHINNVQKSVVEVELVKAAEGVGGVDGEIPDEDSPGMPEVQRQQVQELKQRVTMALSKIQVSSAVKSDLCTAQKVAKLLARPLRSHLPVKRGKYEKTGQFTKAKRADKTRNARPYRKTGKHINDYQNPRNKRMRDAQIEERAKMLKVTPALFRKSMLG